MPTDADPAARPATGATPPAIADVHLAVATPPCRRCRPAIHTDDEVARVARPARLGRGRGLGGGGRRRGRSATPGSTDDLARRPVRRCPSAAGQGVGSRAARRGQGAAPGRVLPVGLRDATPRPARFYARHGLVELERTDGSANEERAPDVRMAWPGADPLAFLRRPDRRGRRAARRPAGPPRGAHRRRPGHQARHHPRPGPRAGDRRGDGRPGARARASTGSPGSCTRSSPRASTRRADGLVGGGCHHRLRRSRSLTSFPQAPSRRDRDPVFRMPAQPPRSGPRRWLQAPRTPSSTSTSTPSTPCSTAPPGSVRWRSARPSWGCPRSR